ncbi:MAG: DUF7696 family protein [Thiomonas sp.]
MRTDTPRGPTWSEQYRLECEARYILRMPLADRRRWLAELERVRGKVDALKDEIVRQWQQRQTAGRQAASKSDGEIDV